MKNQNDVCGGGLLCSRLSHPPATLTSHVRTQLKEKGTPAAPLAIQLPAKVPRKPAEKAPNPWVPATHMQSPDGVLGPWLQPGPGLAMAATGE